MFSKIMPLTDSAKKIYPFYRSFCLAMVLCRRNYFLSSYGFSSSHVWMWELNYKDTWTPKNWCFWTMVLEKTLDSPLNFKETKPVNPKENQLWTLIRRTDAETRIFWSPDAKSWLISLTLGKIEGKRRRGRQRMRWLHGITNSMDMSLSKL